MSAEQAMDTALRGSGLQLRITGQGNFSVEPAPQTGAALQLGVTNVTERSLDATTEGSGSYTAQAVTIGKVRIPATRSVTFIPSSMPPPPGLAPCPRTISIASALRKSSGFMP